MSSPTRFARETAPAPAGRTVHSSVALVTALTVLALGLPGSALPIAGRASAVGRELATQGTDRTPMQPVTPLPEAVSPAFSAPGRSLADHTDTSGAASAPDGVTAASSISAVQAQPNEAWLLALGGGLVVVAGLFVLLVLRNKNEDGD